MCARRLWAARVGEHQLRPVRPAQSDAREACLPLVDSPPCVAHDFSQVRPPTGAGFLAAERHKAVDVRRRLRYAGLAAEAAASRTWTRDLPAQRDPSQPSCQPRAGRLRPRRRSSTGTLMLSIGLSSRASPPLRCPRPCLSHTAAPEHAVTPAAAPLPTLRHASSRLLA